MKRIFFILLALSTISFLTSCNKNSAEPHSAISNADDFSNLSPFKYTISTDIEGNENDQIEILVAMNSQKGQFPVKYDLDCNGDGEYEYKGLTENKTCIYPNHSGTYQIWVRGIIPAMFLCARQDDDSDSNCDPNQSDDEQNPICVLPSGADDSHDAIVSIDSWGNIPWKSMEFFAAGCFELHTLPQDSPDLSHVKDMSYMFSNTYAFNQPIEHWNVSNVENMHAMLAATDVFNQPLEKWDVSNVKDMSNMFSAAESFNQPIENWNVSNVKDMSSMFRGAFVFNQPIENWNVSNVKDMSSMFEGCMSFNQPLGKWNVSNVEDMCGMFVMAPAFNQPLEDWNVSNVKDMSDMFHSASSFDQPIEKWNVSNVEDMSYMFMGALFFNQPLNNWNVIKVISMEGMFIGAAAFDQPLDKWNVSNVMTMKEMFYRASSFNHYPSRWVIPEAAHQDMFTDTPVEEFSQKKPLKVRSDF